MVGPPEIALKVAPPSLLTYRLVPLCETPANIVLDALPLVPLVGSISTKLMPLSLGVLETFSPLTLLQAAPELVLLKRPFLLVPQKAKNSN